MGMHYKWKVHELQTHACIHRGDGNKCKQEQARNALMVLHFRKKKQTIVLLWTPSSHNKQAESRAHTQELIDDWSLTATLGALIRERGLIQIDYKTTVYP